MGGGGGWGWGGGGDVGKSRPSQPYGVVARGGGGGGHCLFEGSHPLPNYHTRFSELPAPEFSLTAPYFGEL